MSDGSKTNSTDNTTGGPKSRMASLRQRLAEWQIRQQVVRGMAYGIGSGAVSLLLLWAQSRY